MLARLEALEPLLRCPRTGAALERKDNCFAALGSTDRYEVVAQVPILIDFENSIVSRQGLGPAGNATSVKRPRYAGAKQFLKRLASPEKRSTRRNIASFIAQLLQQSAEPLVLVIGGGSVGQGLQPLYDHDRIRVASFDIYQSSFTLFLADAHSIPLAENAVDGVVIQAVLEHVLEPQKVVDEIWRVLKPGALVYAETPFMQQVHEGAFDFTRFTESGHRCLFRRFDCLDSGTSGGAATALIWSIDFFVRGLFRSRAAGKAFKLMFCWLVLFDLLIPNEYSSDAASGTYFMGRKVERVLTHEEIINFYPGADNLR